MAYLLALVSGLFAEGVLAVKGWDTNAGLTTQTIFSDNVDLTKNDRQSDVGVRVTPSIGIRRDTRFNKLNLQYGLSYLEHFNASEKGELSHNLTTVWNSELFRDTLFLDLNVNAGQTLASGTSSGDDFNTGSTIQTYTYVFSPYTRHHFGSFADLELRYTNDGVIYDSGSADDSTGNAIDLSLNSGRGLKGVSWGINGSYSKVEQNNNANEDDTYSDARATVGFELNRYWATNFYVAYEDNDFDANSEDLNKAGYGAGITWTPNRTIAINLTANSEGAEIGGGVTWTPSRRTRLELSYGDQFLRKNWFFKLNHRSRNGVLSAGYNEDYTATSRDEILERQTFQLVDNFGNTVVNPITGEQILVEQDSPDLDSETYILSRFTLGYDINLGRRDSLSFGAHHTNRDYQVSQRDETSWGFNSSWSHNLAANLSSNLTVTWEESNYELNDEDSTEWSLAPGLTYNMAQKTFLTLELQHRAKDSSISSSGYTENRATLTLGTSW